MKEEYKYITFPLPMIRKFFTDPSRAAADIIDYGIYYTSMNILKIESPESPYRQLTYEFIRQGLEMPHGDSYRVPGSISKRLISLMKKDRYLGTLDYGGFTPESDFEEFDCEDDVRLLMYIAENDESFKGEVEEWYRLRQVQDVVDVTFSVSEHQQIREAYRRIDAGFFGERQVPVSCKTSILQERQDVPGTERERAKLCLYLGIRSLIGRAEIAVTTGEAIKGRMFGAKNKEELQTVLKDKKLASVYEKWCTRYQYEKMLEELVDIRMVNKITFGRNTFVTCSLQDDHEFMEAIVMRINSANYAEKRRRLKEREKNNREILKQMLKGSGSDSSIEIPFAEIIEDD